MSNDSSGLPSGWVRVRVRDVAEVRLGRQRSPANRAGDNARKYLRAANVTWKGLDLSDVNEMDFKPSEFERYKLRQGDILLSEASGSPKEVGKPAIWRDELPDCCFQNTLIRVRSRGPSPEFLRYRFLHDALRGSYVDASKGVGIHHLGAERFGELAIELPPLPEQVRIVAELEKHLTRLDAGVAALRRAQAQLKRYRASVLKSACEGRLVPTEAELARREKRDYESADKLLNRILKERRARWEADQLAKIKAAGKAPRDDRWKAKYNEPSPPQVESAPKLPEGWCWARLEQLTTLITSGSRGWAEHYAASGPLFIRAQDIKTDALRLDTAARVQLPANAEGTRTRVASGDLLITITGANVTKTACVPESISEGYVSQHVGLARPVSASTTFFLHVWITSPAHGRRQLEKCAYGAGKPGLNLEQLRDLVVALPPLAEQQRIVAEVQTRLSRIESTELSVPMGLHRAERLRQAVLGHAFRGALVKQSPADKPASRMLERVHSEPMDLADLKRTLRERKPPDATAAERGRS